jgi:hypothetical protein
MTDNKITLKDLLLDLSRTRKRKEALEKELLIATIQWVQRDLRLYKHGQPYRVPGRRGSVKWRSCRAGSHKRNL